TWFSLEARTDREYNQRDPLPMPHGLARIHAMPHEDEAPEPLALEAPAPVSRRKFLTQVAAAAAAAPALGALVGADDALAASHARHHGPASRAPEKPAEAPGAGARPDFSVAKNAAEHEALEKQWKQMTDLLDQLRKAPVPTGGEFATGALAPKRLRREAN